MDQNCGNPPTYWNGSYQYLTQLTIELPMVCSIHRSCTLTRISDMASLKIGNAKDWEDPCENVQNILSTFFLFL
jgi:hypothetical protein